MESTFYSRRRHAIFWLFMLGLPVVLWGSWWALQSNSNRVEDWLPQNFDETRQLLWFDEQFGSDELLMISWPGCTLDDRRLLLFAEHLRGMPKQGDVAEAASSGDWMGQFFFPNETPNEPYFRQVITGPEAVEELAGIFRKNDEQKAIERLRGWMVGNGNSRQTCALALLSKGATTRRHQAIKHVYRSAEEVPGLDREDLRVAGTTIESVAIDNASGDYLLPLNSAAYGICFLLMLLSFRSIWLGFLLFVNALFTQLLSIAVIHYFGGQMDSVLLMVPSLVYVLAISAGVHLINYYRDAIEEGGISGATVRAVRYALAPCTLAAATTALGLASLLVSELLPIRNFGFYASIGVLCGTGVLLLLLPWQTEHFPERRWAHRRAIHAGGSSWDRLTSIIAGGHWAVAALGLILLIGGAYGVTRLRATASVHNMFSADARIIQDYDWLEERIGPLIPIEIVVKIPKPIGAARDQIIDRVDLIDQVRHAVHNVDGIAAATSAATYVPAIPRGGGFRVVGQRRVLNANLRSDENRARLADLGFLREDDEEELWRVSARVNAGDRVDYRKLVNQLNLTLPPIFDRAADSGMPGIEAVVTGGVPVVYKAQDQLLRDLMWSFGCAFALIAVAMTVLFAVTTAPVDRPPDAAVATARNIFCGLVCMIPNLIPAMLVFGAMGWLGIEVEVGTMLTASAALGIAVDDTLHYVTWFRRGLYDGMTRHQAIAHAYRRCGKAMMQTSAICGLGLLVFALSPFGPMARFAWIMFSMLTAALLGDLIVLPAILVGPLGRVFQPVLAPAQESSPKRRTKSSDGAVARL